MNPILSPRPVYQLSPAAYAARRNFAASRVANYDLELWREDQRLLIDLEGILSDLLYEGDAQAAQLLTLSEVWELPLDFSQRTRLLELLWRVGH